MALTRTLQLETRLIDLREDVIELASTCDVATVRANLMHLTGVLDTLIVWVRERGLGEVG